MTGGSWAEISSCGTWRYGLGHRWAPGAVLGWLMLNPSTADAEINDPTILKCMTIARRERYNGIWVANLYALRATSPLALRKHPDPVGPQCDEWLKKMLAAVPQIVVAWGSHGGERWAATRRGKVLAMLADARSALSCLGMTIGGEPRHSCRLANAIPLEEW